MSVYNDRRAARRELRDDDADTMPYARTNNAVGMFAGLAFVVFLALCAYIVLTRWLGEPPTVAQPTARPAVVLPAPASNPYIVNVGQQAPHVPRSEPTPAAPAVEPAPAVEVPPAPAVPAVEPAPAVPLPTIAPAQAAVIGARGSGTCPAGQVFYPRSGCHTPGSGGAMPGPVWGTK